MSDETPITLKPNVANQIHNSNPMTWDVEIETEAGSLIAFTVPASGQFTVTPVEQLRRVTINCGELHTYGPRAIDMD